MHQSALMKVDPATGAVNPYPSQADQYRAYHGPVAWLINPWNGAKRDAKDVGSDIFGKLIRQPDDPPMANRLTSFVIGTGQHSPRAGFIYLTPPAAGEYWPGQGGYYICTLPALLDMPARHLIAGADQAEELTFGPSEEISGADSHINGHANTVALRSSGKKHPAADWARGYTSDGHTDFFLPARLDMVMAHICAKQLFKTSGYYWTSTQGSRLIAFVQCFEHGSSDWGIKDYEHRVRAFRVIPL